MSKLYDDHVQRLVTALLRRYNAGQIARWICENTNYGFRPYSFKDHEYQEKILSDTNRVKNVRKCSQVGISEASARMALALVRVMRSYTVAYTLPTASFASKFVKTRIDPVIQGSEELKRSIHKTNDNDEVKQFDDSFLWIRGAASSNAPISIPCDHLIHDEVDFSDLEVLGQYNSRLTHSPWKRIDRISTPTLPGYGIDKFFQESRRNFLFCKCNHCGHQFIPSYYDHVRLPGFSKDLREITKSDLGKFDLNTAYVECPHCGRAPSLLPQHREWVWENNQDTFAEVAYQVSPFDAPKIITPGSLIQSSLAYDRIQDFENFNLGLPSEDNEATITRQDMLDCFQHFEVPGSVSFVMGIDVGNVYHITVAAVTADERMLPVYREKVPMREIRRRYFELLKAWNISSTVIDSGPHSETVMALQEEDINCHAAVYVNKKGLRTHDMVERDEKFDSGVQFLRQINVNHSRAFDAYMQAIRDGLIKMRIPDDDAEKEEVIKHHTSMKRVRYFDRATGEMSFSWKKTDGNDHFHHSGLYAFIAAKVRGAQAPLIQLNLASLRKFQVKDPYDQNRMKSWNLVKR